MQGGGGRGGKQGVHTEHLGHLLAEMQFLQRAYPGRAVVTRGSDDARGHPDAAARGGRAGARPALGAIWDALDAVPDPEIPVVSVRRARHRARASSGTPPIRARWSSRVTPTYSGCPATELIMDGIRDALAAPACARVRLDDRGSSPAWTTDWIAPEAKRKLRALRHRAAGRRRAGDGRRVDVAGISPLRRAAASCPARAAARRRPRLRRAVRLDRLQGALPLRGLPRAVRLFQVALTAAMPGEPTDR